MNKNAAKIKMAIAKLVSQPCEVISGTVQAGSLDTDELTVSVLPSDGSAPIAGVMLSALTGDDSGLLLFPKDNSNVVIASIDGPGEWCLVRASEIDTATMHIGNVQCQWDAEQISLQNGQTLFNISNSAFKMNTQQESLLQLLKDCFTSIAQITVPTPAGTSSVPVNATDFTNLITRLNNLLNQ